MEQTSNNSIPDKVLSVKINSVSPMTKSISPHKVKNTTLSQSKKVKKTRSRSSINRQSRKNKVFHPKRYGHSSKYTGPPRYFGRKYYSSRYSPLFKQVDDTDGVKNIQK
jgi:hypothetical protein